MMEVLLQTFFANYLLHDKTLKFPLLKTVNVLVKNLENLSSMANFSRILNLILSFKLLHFVWLILI